MGFPGGHGLCGGERTGQVHQVHRWCRITGEVPSSDRDVVVGVVVGVCEGHSNGQMASMASKPKHSMGLP